VLIPIAVLTDMDAQDRWAPYLWLRPGGR
jgi:hypothetical protein